MKNFKLTEEQLHILKRAHRRERNKRRADRLKAVYLLGKGWLPMDVSEALLLDEDTLRNYVKRYQTEGIVGLLKDDYIGRDGKLSDEELTILDEHLQEVTYTRVKDIVEYVKDEFDEEYTISGMTKLLRRMGYVYKKPKKVPGKADQGLQQEFLKRYWKIRNKMQSEDSLFFMDGVHPVYQPVISYGWMKRGTVRVIRSTAGHKRLNINGAVDIDTLDVVVTFNDSLTEESTLDFLSMLRNKVPKGRIYLVCDRARYYHTELVERYAKSMEIYMIYLPPYSPNLNIIERLWRYFQKNVLHNHYYSTFAEFYSSCKMFFANIRWHKNNLKSLLTENFEKLPI